MISTGKIFILFGGLCVILTLFWQKFKNRKSPDNTPAPMRFYKRASFSLMLLLGAIFFLWLLNHSGSE